MKILCVTPSYWPAFQYGGPIFVVHYLNVALVKQGVDVTVYTTSVGLRNKVQENRETYVDGVRVIYFSVAQSLEALGTTGWQFSRRMTKALMDHVGEFDLVHINAIWNYPSLAAAFLSKVRDVPYILTVHGALYPSTLANSRWKKLPYYLLFAKRVLRNAAAIHFTVEDEAEKCRFMIGKATRVVVVPYVLDLSEFAATCDESALTDQYPKLKNRKTILFLSRISWKKGLDILIQAFSIIEKKQGNVHLLIVGSDETGYGDLVRQWIRDRGMFCESYGAECKELPLSKAGKQVTVTFTGMLTGAEKVQAYRGSDIFVLPSYSENFGVVVIEAMVCGLPVIVSDQVGLHKEIAEAKAGIVIRTDAKQLAEAITFLLDNPEMRREMGRNGQQLVIERYAPDRVTASMISTYQSLL